MVCQSFDSTPCARRSAKISPPPPEADWIEKGRHDFVTEADRRAEALITEALTRDVPGSAVMGEELSPHAPPAGEVAWIVDPLDGTTNFLHGYPQYAVSIACVVRGSLRGISPSHPERRHTRAPTRRPPSEPRP